MAHINCSEIDWGSGENLKLKKENVIHFITFNYKPLEKTQILKDLIILWLCSAATAAFGTLKEILFPAFFLMDFYYTCLCIQVLRKNIAKEEAKFLIDGFASLFLSIIGVVAAYKIATLSLGDNLELLLILLLLLILDIIIFAYVVYKNIEKDNYSGEYTNKKIIMYALAGAIAGTIASRIILPRVDAAYLPLVISCCIIIISFLLGIGSLNLLKYYLLKSAKE